MNAPRGYFRWAFYMSLLVMLMQSRELNRRGNMRDREMGCLLAQGHTTSKWQRWDLDRNLSQPQARDLSTSPVV